MTWHAPAFSADASLQPQLGHLQPSARPAFAKRPAVRPSWYLIYWPLQQFPAACQQIKEINKGWASGTRKWMHTSYNVKLYIYIYKTDINTKIHIFYTKCIINKHTLCIATPLLPAERLSRYRHTSIRHCLNRMGKATGCRPGFLKPASHQRELQFSKVD